jgi:UDP-N-acetylmuramate--alanine ligase
MSAIAHILMKRGIGVSGSDLKESRNTRRLEQLGARIFIGHRPENVEGADVLVVSSAVPERNKELKRASELGLKIMPRAAMLNELMLDGRGIAVAGTHGKTTTTSMVSMIMKEAGLEPTYIIGGELNDVGSNAYAGTGQYVIAEADESDGSFLLLHPFAEIVTNIEEDHLDFYKDRDEIIDYFRRFIMLVPPDGMVVLSGDDPGSRLLKGCSAAREITFGEGEGSDFTYRNLQVSPSGSGFELWQGERALGEIKLSIPGLHNVRNAMAALALTLSLGVDLQPAARALARFSGVQRRYQLVDQVSGIRLVDDYAHHPSEVRTTLKTAALEKPARIVCLFQPHRFSRTAALWKEFGEALLGADTLIVTDVYSAGEDPLPGVNGKLIVNALLEADPSKQVVYVPQRSMLGQAAARLIRPGDLVITMGAGDISQCAGEISAILRAEASGACGL